MFIGVLHTIWTFKNVFNIRGRRKESERAEILEPEKVS